MAKDKLHRENKMLRYEASVIAEREGLPFEAAMEKAIEARKARKEAAAAKKPNRWAKKGSRGRKGGKTKAGKTIYKVITLVPGGAPGGGKRR